MNAWEAGEVPTRQSSWLSRMKLPQNKVLLGRYVLPELCRLVKTCRIPQLSVAERGQGRERITPRRVEKTILELIYFLAA